MTPRALAWGWLQALPARPFALLESAGSGATKRFSLLAGEPLFVFEGRGSRSVLRVEGKTWKLNLPPEEAFSALGRGLSRRKSRAFWPLMHALGYEAGGRFERLPRPRKRSQSLPDWWAFLPGLWATWEPQRKAWRLSKAEQDLGTAHALARELGLPLRALDKAWRRPDQAYAKIRALIAQQSSEPPVPPAPRLERRTLRLEASKSAYLRAVRTAQRHILVGDIYQANLAHRFEAPCPDGAFALYQRLTRLNPSPMAAYLDLGETQVVSASPERLFRVEGRRVETWPIAGTAPRKGRAGEREALTRSVKNGAEHVMLVDLERNDLGRVCVGGSVRVPQFKAVRSYSHVHHLVSRVVGTLRPGLGLPELLRAGFPGGSITGAPKIRCMEIIAQLEGEARGWYTGSLGWWDPRARRADLNILIRTLFVRKGRATAHVGAGIVLDSNPEAEWRETLAKAGALLQALGASR